MTLLVVEIRIRTVIINTKIIIIGAIVIAIDIKAIVIIIIKIIEIKGVITPLKDKKKRISIKIKSLRGILA